MVSCTTLRSAALIGSIALRVPLASTSLATCWFRKTGESGGTFSAIAPFTSTHKRPLEAPVLRCTTVRVRSWRASSVAPGWTDQEAELGTFQTQLDGLLTVLFHRNLGRNPHLVGQAPEKSLRYLGLLFLNATFH